MSPITESPARRSGTLGSLDADDAFIVLLIAAMDASGQYRLKRPAGRITSSAPCGDSVTAPAMPSGGESSGRGR
jgi:hypothetical protein